MNDWETAVAAATILLRSTISDMGLADELPEHVCCVPADDLPEAAEAARRLGLQVLPDTNRMATPGNILVFPQPFWTR